MDSLLFLITVLYGALEDFGNDMGVVFRDCYRRHHSVCQIQVTKDASIRPKHS